MACLFSNDNKINTKITSYSIKEKVTYYNIEVQVGDVYWTLSHRYNEFAELNDKLVKEQSLSKDQLPPKKVLGNMDPKFLEKRKQDLELYLQNVVSFLEKSLPKCLIDFLHLGKYDINILLQDLALFCYEKGDTYLSMGNWTHSYSPLQLHAITKRLNQECPTEESLNQEHSFCHILDFCGSLRVLVVQGNSYNIGSSNVTYNQLAYDLFAFKNLKKLFLYNVNVSQIGHLGTLRQHLEELVASKANNLFFPRDILLCDHVHRNVNIDHAHDWTKLTSLDLSKNDIVQLDESLSLVSNLEVLNLESNKLETITHLKPLRKLRRLNLGRNQIQDLRIFQTELNPETLQELNLCENRITSLSGLHWLERLQSLDLGSNFVSDIGEIAHINTLQDLTNLNLTGNPIATIIDYRIKILQLFFKRADKLVLDSEKPTRKEIDMTAVLNAMILASDVTLFNPVEYWSFPPTPNFNIRGSM